MAAGFTDAGAGLPELVAANDRFVTVSPRGVVGKMA
jgi:hypothetical protein